MNGVCFMRRGHPLLTLGCAIIVRRTARQIIHCLNEYIISPPISDFVTSFFLVPQQNYQWQDNNKTNRQTTPAINQSQNTPHTKARQTIQQQYQQLCAQFTCVLIELTHKGQPNPPHSEPSKIQQQHNTAYQHYSALFTWVTH